MRNFICLLSVVFLFTSSVYATNEDDKDLSDVQVSEDATSEEPDGNQNNINETLDKLAKKVNDEANKINDAIDVDSMVDDGVNFGKKAKENAGKNINEVIEKAKNAIDKISDEVSEKKGDVLDKSDTLGKKILDSTDKTINTVREKINDTTKKLGNDTENDTDDGLTIKKANINKPSTSLYDESLDFEDNEEKAKREKFIADYKQARTNEALVEMLRSKALDARVDSRGIIINLENALFDFNSAELTDSALPNIKEISKFLQSLPDRNVSVEGHTDSVGTVMFNHKLSEGRARNVVEELVKNGVSRSRLEFKGYGESDPVATNRTEEGRNRNRRVELVVK